MKKLALFLFTICTALTLGSCGQSGDTMFAPNFQLVCNHTDGDSTYYLKDIDTNIMYVYHNNYYIGALSAYYDIDGKPMTYERFQEVHMKKYHNI